MSEKFPNLAKVLQSVQNFYPSFMKQPEDRKFKAAEMEGDEDKEVSDRNDSEKFDKMEGKSMELRAEEVIWMKRRRANVDNNVSVKKKKVDSP